MPDRDESTEDALPLGKRGEAGEAVVDGADGDSAVRGRWKNLIGYAVAAAFVAFCVWYISAHSGEFAFLSNVSWRALLPAVVLLVPIQIVDSYKYHLFFRNFGLRLSPVELIALTWVMFIGNLVTPMRGGSGFMAYYLKRVHGFEFHRFGVVYAGAGLLTVLIGATLSLVGIGVLLAKGFFNPYLTVCVAILFAGCLYWCVFPPAFSRKREGVVGMIAEMGHSWHMLTRNRRLLAGLTGCLLVMAFLSAGCFYFIYRSLGEPLSFFAVLIVSNLGVIAGMIPLTPGSLGIFDAVTIQVPQLFGLDEARSLMGTVILRVLCVVEGIVFGGVSLVYLLIKMRAAARGAGSEKES